MKVFSKFGEYKKKAELFLTIGFFDGIHLGHQKILKTLVSKSKSQGYPSAVVTFSFHPFKSLDSSNPATKDKAGRHPLAILPLKQRLNYIDQLGLDYAFVLDFNKNIAQMEAQNFMEKILVEKLKVKKIYIGANFRFGKNRDGNIALLEEEGKKFGFSVIPIPLFRVADEIVSSTKIRGYITEGNLKKVEEFLGRKYSLLGKVVKGKGISKNIQFPTANIQLDEVILPPEGIYAGWVKIDGKTYKSAFFVATKPKRLIEAHIIGLKKNIYEKEVEIIFFKKLRSRVIFKNRAEAQKQIAKDVEKTLEQLKVEI